MKYEEYLQSDIWREKRMKALKRDGFQCQICGSGKNLQVHHIRYPNTYGEEPLEDLITVCDVCHSAKLHKRDMELKQLKKDIEETVWFHTHEAIQVPAEYINFIYRYKSQDLYYGGNKNLCNLATLKALLEESDLVKPNEYGRFHRITILQNYFAGKHRKWVYDLRDRHGMQIDDIETETKLPRSFIWKHYNIR